MILIFQFLVILKKNITWFITNKHESDVTYYESLRGKVIESIKPFVWGKLQGFDMTHEIAFRPLQIMLHYERSDKSKIIQIWYLMDLPQIDTLSYVHSSNPECFTFLVIEFVMLLYFQTCKLIGAGNPIINASC